MQLNRFSTARRPLNVYSTFWVYVIFMRRQWDGCARWKFHRTYEIQISKQIYIYIYIRWIWAMMGNQSFDWFADALILLRDTRRCSARILSTRTFVTQGRTVGSFSLLPCRFRFLIGSACLRGNYASPLSSHCAENKAFVSRWPIKSHARMRARARDRNL